MTCPQCGKEVIGFWEWGSGVNAFRYTCPHCLEPLKANGTTIKWCIGIMLWAMIVLGVCIYLQQSLKIEEARFRSFLFPVMVLTILPWVFLAWKKGGYISRRKRAK